MATGAIGTEELQDFDESILAAGTTDACTAEEGGLGAEDEGPRPPAEPAGGPDGSPAARKQLRRAAGVGAEVAGSYVDDDAIRALGSHDIDDKTVKSYTTLRHVRTC